jgi:phosphohistidine phosphatase SixA
MKCDDPPPTGLPRRRVAQMLGGLGLAWVAEGAFAGVAAEIATGRAAWRMLATRGAVALIRHARTSGGAGDPAGFSLEDCATQRNLTDQGRAQAAALGQRFRANGVAVELVLSSRWCRCLDTARIAFGGVEPWTALDNLYGNNAKEPTQSAEVRKRIRAWARPGALVLVTHGANILPLTGISPAEGEVVVLRPNDAKDFNVVGRIAPGE